MITTFQETSQYEVYMQALKLTGFETIRDLLLAHIARDENYTALQKSAIMYAGEKLKTYPDSNPGTFDGPLLGILNLNWQDIGLDNTSIDALTKSQRESIFSGLMIVCKALIDDESERLESIADKDTALSADWDVVSEP